LRDRWFRRICTEADRRLRWRSILYIQAIPVSVCRIWNTTNIQTVSLWLCIRAKNRNIPTCVVERKNYPTKLSFNEAILAELKKAGAELIVLAGYMRLVGEPILSAYEGRIVNIHPALLPSFPGLDGQKQAIDFGVRISGCTVHFVDSGMDTGRIIAQKAVPVYPDDTEESLSARILEQEHILYSEVLKDLTRGKIVLENGKVKYLS